MSLVAVATVTDKRACVKPFVRSRLSAFRLISASLSDISVTAWVIWVMALPVMSLAPVPLESWACWKPLYADYGIGLHEAIRDGFYNLFPIGGNSLVGGPKWALCIDTARSYRAGELSPMMFVDTAFGLKHNGSNAYNKFWNIHDLDKVLNVARKGNLQYLEHPASSSVRKLYYEALGLDASKRRPSAKKMVALREMALTIAEEMPEEEPKERRRMRRYIYTKEKRKKSDPIGIDASPLQDLIVDTLAPVVASKLAKTMADMLTEDEPIDEFNEVAGWDIDEPMLTTTAASTTTASPGEVVYAPYGPPVYDPANFFPAWVNKGFSKEAMQWKVGDVIVEEPPVVETHDLTWSWSEEKGWVHDE